MSHDPNYYLWLYSIDGTANPRHCLVLNELPMTTPLEAISFVTKHFPEMTPQERPIVADHARISEIASHSQHEVEYLITLLEGIAEDLKKQAETCSNEADKITTCDILSDVQYKLLRDRAKTFRSEACGVYQCLHRLRTRHAELAAMAGKGRYSDWRL